MHNSTIVENTDTIYIISIHPSIIHSKTMQNSIIVENTDTNYHVHTIHPGTIRYAY